MSTCYDGSQVVVGMSLDQRTDRIGRILANDFDGEDGCESEDEAVDLLVDTLHFCERHGIDVKGVLDKVLEHYAKEGGRL